MNRLCIGVCCVMVVSLSKGNLATQNYEKFLEYSSNGNFKLLNPYLITSQVAGEERLFVPTGYNVYLLPRDLYKTNGKLMQGAMESFLRTLTGTPLIGGLNKKVYLIKDECHIKTTNLNNLSTEYFSRVYNFSATPKLARGQHPDVEIKETEAVNAKLIKEVVLNNEGGVTVGEAISKFQEVKKQYRNLLGVNPCLIIQISNKDKANEELNEIYRELDKAENIDLKWMTIVDNDKECDTNDTFKAKKLPVQKWKDYAKEPLATIDVIIFKMVITEGWDIPRACMLYQVRNSQSKQLDEQVMGRVRRNPRLLDFDTLSEEAQQLAMTAWVWGVVDSTKFNYRQVGLKQGTSLITDEVKVKTTRLKTLSNKKDFDLEEFLRTQLKKPTDTDIFKLYRSFKNAENSVQNMGWTYADGDYSKWIFFCEHIETISKESDKYICDYESSMEIVTDEREEEVNVSFPVSSYYVNGGSHYNNISDWVWIRNDGHDKFSFDSEAERNWASILMSLSNSKHNAIKQVDVGKKNPKAGQHTINGVESELVLPEATYLWGKNYLPNSLIKFEYYIDTVHSSYPDFVMKDSYDRIHIFEVKSVNKSSNVNFSEKEYNTKIIQLEGAYKRASKLTKQIFYLPVLEGEDWKIKQFVDGESKSMGKEEFIDFCKTPPTGEE